MTSDSDNTNGKVSELVRHSLLLYKPPSGFVTADGVELTPTAAISPVGG